MPFTREELAEMARADAEIEADTARARNDRRRANYEANKDKRRAYNRAYYAANKQRIKEQRQRHALEIAGKLG